jgi:hypothetical protein
VRAFAHSLKLSLYDRNSSLPSKGIKSTAVYLIVQRLVRLHTHEESCSFNYICEKTRTYIASLLTCGSMVEQCWCRKVLGKENFRTNLFLIVVVDVRCGVAIGAGAGLQNAVRRSSTKGRE